MGSWGVCCLAARLQSLVGGGGRGRSLARAGAHGQSSLQGCERIGGGARALGGARPREGHACSACQGTGGTAGWVGRNGSSACARRRRGTSVGEPAGAAGSGKVGAWVGSGWAWVGGFSGWAAEGRVGLGRWEPGGAVVWSPLPRGGVAGRECEELQGGRWRVRDGRRGLGRSAGGRRAWAQQLRRRPAAPNEMWMGQPGQGFKNGMSRGAAKARPGLRCQPQRGVGCCSAAAAQRLCTLGRSRVARRTASLRLRRGQRHERLLQPGRQHGWCQAQRRRAGGRAGAYQQAGQLRRGAAARQLQRRQGQRACGHRIWSRGRLGCVCRADARDVDSLPVCWEGLRGRARRHGVDPCSTWQPAGGGMRKGGGLRARRLTQQRALLAAACCCLPRDHSPAEAGFQALALRGESHPDLWALACGDVIACRRGWDLLKGVGRAVE